MPATYTPGTPFSFDVRVPLLTDFTAFSAQLVFATDLVDPPLFVSAAAPTAGPGGRYVFPSNTNFQSSSFRSDMLSEVSLYISGSTATGVLAAPDGNDTLARVTVQPGAELTGPITISLGSDTLFMRNMETSYSDTDAVTVDRSDTGPVTNPAPAPAWCCSASAGCCSASGTGSRDAFSSGDRPPGLSKRMTGREACRHNI